MTAAAARIERELLDAIVSAVSDANVFVLRTREAASVLLSALAFVLACSQSVRHSPTAVPRTIDELGRRIRRRVAPAETDQELRPFRRCCFNCSGIGANS
jgi:hypothetical protein